MTDHRTPASGGSPVWPDGAWRVRWSVAPSQPPLADHTLVVDKGLLIAIRPPDPRDIDLGSAAAIPGLVNAHTHWDLSGVRSPIAPSGSFPDWLAAVIAHRHDHRTAPAEAVAAGANESLQSGTAWAGDIVGPAWSPAELPAHRPGVVAFRELLGFRPEQRAAQLEAAVNHLHGRSPDDAGILRGLSPHAPYSVHPDLFHDLVDLAARAGAPLAMHLAESREELQLLGEGTGPFVDFLQRLGAWDPGALRPGTRVLDYLREFARLDRAVVVHGNYLEADEVEWLAGHPQASVVYCPRTHAAFGHAPHPWLRLLERGASVALGTDSRASNPDLNVWAEVLFLRSHFPQVAPALLLELATIRGARALGVDSRHGAMRLGGPADMALIALPPREGAPWDLLFDRVSAPRMLECSPIDAG